MPVRGIHLSRYEEGSETGAEEADLPEDLPSADQGAGVEETGQVAQGHQPEQEARVRWVRARWSSLYFAQWIVVPVPALSAEEWGGVQPPDM